jgi:hypothetical protein
MWDGDVSLIELTDPVTGTMSAVQSSLYTSVYHNRCYYLFFDNDSNGRKNYICWDFRYIITTSNGRSMPSPTIGDYTTALTYTAYSTISNADGIMYVVSSGTSSYIYAILGTGANKYSYPMGTGAKMVVQTPDFCIAEGLGESNLGDVYIQSCAETSIPDTTFTLTPRRNSIVQTAVNKTLSGTGVNYVYSNLMQGDRGSHLGMRFEANLTALGTGANMRELESVAINATLPIARSAI